MGNPFEKNEHKLYVIDRKVDLIIDVLRLLVKATKGLAMTLDELAVQVALNTQVEASAVTLIQGLADQIAAAATDPAKVQALADQLKASAETLASSITANTPSAPIEPTV